MASSSAVPSTNDYRRILIQQIQKAHPQASKQKLDKLFNEYWSRTCTNPESHHTKVIDHDEWEKVKVELNKKSIKSKGSLSSFWGKQRTIPIQSKSISSPITTTPKQSRTTRKRKDIFTTPTPKRFRITKPAQYQCQLEIDSINSKIADLIESQQNTFIDQKKIKEKIKELQNSKSKQNKKLSRLKSGELSSKKFRERRRIQIKKYMDEHPDDQSCLFQEAPGRPAIEKYYPGFSGILMDIVNHCCATGTVS